MSIHHIFSPFYFKWTLPIELQSLIEDKVKDFLSKNQDKLERPTGWQCEVETTFNHMFDPSKGTDSININGIFVPYINDMISYLNWDLKNFQNIKTEYWINVYKSSHWQESHDHVPNKFSGVYCVKFNPAIHGRLIFENPLKQQNQYAYQNQYDLDTRLSFFKGSIVAEVKQGDLIIFPSSLVHRVERPKINGTEERITIAFNVDF
jgi:hypothetical protein